MPIKQSAIKALRQSDKKHSYNLRAKREMKNLVKETREFVVASKKEDAKKSLFQAIKSIDKAAQKEVIKKNTASRMVSRLTKAVNSVK